MNFEYHTLSRRKRVMPIFALQSPAGGFLDEELRHFNKSFDDWCVQFESLEDAQLILETLPHRNEVDIVEITPLSYPKYFFANLQGIIHATREYKGKIICIVEPVMGANFRIAVCDMKSKQVRLLKTRFKTSQSVESAFANPTFEL